MKKLFATLVSLCMLGLCLFSACGPKEPSNQPGNQVHTHTYSDTWSSDEENHWHVCMECGEKSEKEPHTWGLGVIVEEAGCGTTGIIKYSCTVCGKEKTETIPAGTHTFETQWSFDESEHWHKSTCGHDVISEQGKHQWNTENKCEVCGYEMQYTQGLEYVQNNYSGFSVKSIGVANEKDIVIPAYTEGNGEYGEPRPINRIAEEAFRGNQNIISVTFSDRISCIEQAAFFECKNLKSVKFSDNLREIENMAFSDCTMLENFVLPEGLLSLRQWCFKDCDSLTEITIPSTVQYVTSAFLGCDSLEKVVFADAEFRGTTDFYGAFDGCASLRYVEIPDRITGISDYAFNDCTRLNSIDLPDTIETIGESAFEGCTGFVTFTVPASVTQIDTNAFSGCINLVEVYNKSSLEIVAGENTNGYIAWNAKNVYTPTEGKSIVTYTDNGLVFIYDGVEAILTSYIGTDEEVDLPDSFEANDGTIISNYSIGEVAFDNSPHIVAINVTSENKNYSSVDGVLYDKTGMKLVRVPTGKAGEFVVPDKVRQMEYFAFFYCAKLSSVIFGANITTIEYDCFTGCDGLITITLGDSVNNFSASSLEKLPLFKEVKVADGNKYYKNLNGLLYGSEGTCLEFMPKSTSGELVIPDGVTNLGNSGLRENANITSVSLPASMKYIYYGFYNCVNLTKVTFRGTVEQWNAIRKTSVNGSPTWRKNAPFTQVICSDGIVEY